MASRQQRRQQQRRESHGHSSRSSGRNTTPWYVKPWALGLAVVAVIAVVVVFVLAGRSTPKPQAAFGPPAPTVMSSLTSPTASMYATVGTGGQSNPWTPLHGASGLNTSPPELLYVGADYCPYCAFERWSTINALSRFGKADNLSLMKSSSTDVYPSTSTFSYYGSNIVARTSRSRH